jgi:hypothetical protein
LQPFLHLLLRDDIVGWHSSKTQQQRTEQEQRVRRMRMMMVMMVMVVVVGVVDDNSPVMDDCSLSLSLSLSEDGPRGALST